MFDHVPSGINPNCVTRATAHAPKLFNLAFLALFSSFTKQNPRPYCDVISRTISLGPLRSTRVARTQDFILTSSFTAAHHLTMADDQVEVAMAAIRSLNPSLDDAFMMYAFMLGRKQGTFEAEQKQRIAATAVCSDPVIHFSS